MKKTLLLTLFTLVQFALFAQPKYEFRAFWVATAFNIDWPSKPGLSTDQQKAEAISILEMHRELNMNAVIFQVRPAADAFYPSELEPWSQFLTGTPGKAPEPFYDPLQFWIEESHKRGMEFHAWLNPFRVSLNASQPLAGNHIAFQQPGWILNYGNKLYFDPGLPQTREFVNKVVKDIVSRYDVDAIHFDDYFYPYPLAEAFPDTVSFSKYSRGFSDETKADWRRENVDIMIMELNKTIKEAKPWIKFGISPFGVWRNKTDDPRGSDTKAGTTNYDQLYADVIKWQEKGWIDYLLPQIYWQIGHPSVDFDLLANWWKNHTYNRGMYIGHAVYKSSATSEVESWTKPGELPNQIKTLREIPEIQGSAFYSSKHFNRDLMGFQDSLRLVLYQKPAIVPAMKWIDKKDPLPVSKIKKSGRKVKYKTEEIKDEMDKPNLFAIYINEKGTKFNHENAENLLILVKTTKIKLAKINKKRKKYEIRVSVLDRLNNESKMSKPVVLKL
jgi:uncharacterized lipoprotein YddW (UPF0748 family)